MKFHIISKRDLNRLIKNGDVVLDKIYGGIQYEFHEGMPKFIPLLTGGMMQDIIASRRRSFDYGINLIDDEIIEDPYIDGMSGEYDRWFVPIWCVVEWLQKEGIL